MSNTNARPIDLAARNAAGMTAAIASYTPALRTAALLWQLGATDHIGGNARLTYHLVRAAADAMEATREVNGMLLGRMTAPQIDELVRLAPGLLFTVNV